MRLIYDKPNEPPMYMVTDDEIAGTDSEINAMLPGAIPGTIITTAGYGTMKQKAEDESWATL